MASESDPTSGRVLQFPRRKANAVANPGRLIEVSGRKLLVRRSGTGPPILLLAGLGMPLAAWTPLLSRLPAAECIEVALPGRAAAGVTHPVLTMSGFAKLARGLLDRLDIAEVDVLGLSFGGLVAQQLAYDAPDRVRGLVLASTSCGLGGVPVNPASWWGAVLSAVWHAADRHRPLTQLWPVGLLRQLGADWSTGPRMAGWAEQLTAASVWSSLPWLSQLTQQTLVIAGTADTLVSEANASILASGIPRARLHRVSGGCHMCLLDQAAEVAPVVAAFLDSLAPTAVGEVTELG